MVSVPKMYRRLIVFTVLALAALACSGSAVLNEALEQVDLPSIVEDLPLDSPSGADSTAGVSLGRVLLQEDFSDPNAWENFVADQMDLQVSDGVYRVQTSGGGIIWGLNETVHSNVVIEVTSNQLSADDDNAYGVMCRADTSNNGDGYYFFISGDGFYAVGMGVRDIVDYLVEWTPSRAINQGRTLNTIRAVCVDDYLALYVNDVLLTSLRDSRIRSGYAGFAASALEGSTTDVAFDDLIIWEASLSE